MSSFSANELLLLGIFAVIIIAFLVIDLGVFNKKAINKQFSLAKVKRFLEEANIGGKSLSTKQLATHAHKV